jgi:hypothetical protein
MIYYALVVAAVIAKLQLSLGITILILAIIVGSADFPAGNGGSSDETTFANFQGLTVRQNLNCNGFGHSCLYLLPFIPFCCLVRSWNSCRIFRVGVLAPWFICDSQASSHGHACLHI